jgi:hypothetical protein
VGDKVVELPGRVGKGIKNKSLKASAGTGNALYTWWNAANMPGKQLAEEKPKKKPNDMPDEEWDKISEERREKIAEWHKIRRRRRIRAGMAAGVIIAGDYFGSKPYGFRI